MSLSEPVFNCSLSLSSHYLATGHLPRQFPNDLLRGGPVCSNRSGSISLSSFLFLPLAFFTGWHMNVGQQCDDSSSSNTANTDTGPRKGQESLTQHTRAPHCWTYGALNYFLAAHIHTLAPSTVPFLHDRTEEEHFHFLPPIYSSSSRRDHSTFRPRSCAIFRLILQQRAHIHNTATAFSHGTPPVRGHTQSSGTHTHSAALLLARGLHFFLALVVPSRKIVIVPAKKLNYTQRYTNH